jgi:hypothetical protein
MCLQNWQAVFNFNARAHSLRSCIKVLQSEKLQSEKLQGTGFFFPLLLFYLLFKPTETVMKIFTVLEHSGSTDEFGEGYDATLLISYHKTEAGAKAKIQSLIQEELTKFTETPPENSGYSESVYNHRVRQITENKFVSFAFYGEDLDRYTIGSITVEV